jgi:hypothetical protein
MWTPDLYTITCIYYFILAEVPIRFFVKNGSDQPFNSSMKVMELRFVELFLY